MYTKESNEVDIKHLYKLKAKIEEKYTGGNLVHSTYSSLTDKYPHVEYSMNRQNR